MTHLGVPMMQIILAIGDTVLLTKESFLVLAFMMEGTPIRTTVLRTTSALAALQPSSTVMRDQISTQKPKDAPHLQHAIRIQMTRTKFLVGGDLGNLLTISFNQLSMN
jgi:hypothetical protein